MRLGESTGTRAGRGIGGFAATVAWLLLCAAFGWELEIFSVRPPSFGGVPVLRENPLGRRNWEWERQHDPRTGSIPAGIREQELDFVRAIPAREVLRKGGGAPAALEISWTQRGPVNVGGRTRALAVDLGNPAVLLAGGVSGGLWKSTDGGGTWRKVTRPSQLHSVTCIVQDPRPGKGGTWYYGTGELTGNSASGGGGSLYRGDGIFKSTDGGESWNLLPSTVAGTPHIFSSMFQYVWNLAIDPSAAGDELYAATIGGILRTSDGGTNWTAVLGGVADVNSRFTDVAVTSAGVVYASLSEMRLTGAAGAVSQGFWRSTDGLAWADLRPAVGWPASTKRMVIGIAPSNESILYLAGETPGYGIPVDAGGSGVEYNSLWRYRYLSGDGRGGGGEWSDRSAHLPQYGGNVGNFYTQGSYNLVIEVSPLNDSLVFIGGTNLYRSVNGFRTSTGTSWIGGYSPADDFSQYASHHCDQHALVFHPVNPAVLYCGNDGGIFRTDNCTLPSIQWASLNTGYFTTQFYTCAIDHGSSGDAAVVGGMQDNGTFITLSNSPALPWRGLFSGDGAHCAIADGRSSVYVSAQEGIVFRLILNSSGGIVNYARVDPAGGSGYIFINPFILDPTNSNVMYLSAGQDLWRNAALSSIPLSTPSLPADAPTTVGWTRMTGARSAGGAITALSASKSRPAFRLYYGTSQGRVYRLEGAAGATAGTIPADISTGKGLPGGYVSSIAVDPSNGNRAILVFSNYGIPSVFFTTDAGATWSDVSGNLEQNPDGSGSGPSVRSAAIQTYGGGAFYLLGSSTGVYSTQTLAGRGTVWSQEGSSTIGNVVVDMIDVRPTDGLVVVATHGQGIFSGTSAPVPPGPEEVPLITELDQNYPNPFNPGTRIRFTLAARSQVTLKVVSVTGAEVATLIDEVREAGTDQEETWVPERLATGIYFAVLQAGESRFVRKMVYVK